LSSPLCFRVGRGEIVAKLDPFYYRADFRHNLQVLTSSAYPNCALGDIVKDIHYGASIPPKYADSGTLFIRAMNIRDGRFDLSDVVYLDESVHPNLDRYRLQEDDLVMVRSGVNVGDVCRVPAELAGSINGSYSITFRVSQDANPEYISQFLNSRFGRLQVAQVSGRSAQPNINSEEICELRVVIPPRPIQDAIADKIDAAYRRKRELETKAEALLEGIDRYVLGELGTEWGKPPDRGKPVGRGAVWFGTWRQDVKRLDPKRYRYQREGPPPQGLRRLGDLLTRRSEKVDRSEYTFEDLQLVSLHFDGSMSARDVKAWRKDIKGALWFAYPGDLVYSKIDARNGAIGLVPDELGRIAVTSEYPVYQVKEGISAEYLKIVLRTLQFTDLLKAMAAGHSGRKRIQPSELEDVLIPVPLLDQQRKIAAEVQHRRERAAALREEAERVVAAAKAEVERMILGEREA